MRLQETDGTGTTFAVSERFGVSVSSGRGRAGSKCDETYLLVELDVVGLELGLLVLDGGSEVVGELVVGVGLAGIVLGLNLEIPGSVGHSVKGHGLVLGVSDFFQVNVRDLLVHQVGWVVRRRVARQLGEVL